MVAIAEWLETVFGTSSGPKKNYSPKGTYSSEVTFITTTSLEAQTGWP
jgi:hypothetical protein